MLGFLHGKILSKSLTNTSCVVVNQNVGYEVTLTPRHFEAVRLEQEVSLWLHTHVREDILALYGFPSDEEKQLFRILLSVSGLGPKHALSLLGEHGADRLVQLVVSKNTTGLSQAHGVGKTLAQRIVLDLAGKLEKLSFFLKPDLKVVAQAPAPSSMREDLVSALTHLGYPSQQIRGVLDRIFDGEDVDSLGFEVCLKRALKEVARHV